MRQTGAAAAKQVRYFEFAIDVVAPPTATERVLWETPRSCASTDPIEGFTRFVSDPLPAVADWDVALLVIIRVAGKVSGKEDDKA